MARVFEYEAVDQKGQQIKQTILAANEEEARRRIKKLGLYPVSLELRVDGATSVLVDAEDPRIKRKTFTIGAVDQQELLSFTRHAAIMQEAGFPIGRLLRVIESQLQAGVLKNALLDLGMDIESGDTLSKAMSKHPKAFDAMYLGLIKAGEVSGNLPLVMNRLANLLERSMKLRKRVLGALVSPAVVSGVAVVVVAAIMYFVVPAFKEMFKEMGLALPAMTRALLSVSTFVAEQWPLLLAAPLAFWGAAKLIRRTPQGRYLWDRISLFIPIFGSIIYKSTVARLTRTLSTLIGSGVPILQALKHTRDAVGNEYMMRTIDQLGAAVREGESLTDTLRRSQVLDVVAVNMIAVAEETGRLDVMLQKIADGYEDDVEIAIDSLSSVLEPFLVVCMAVVIGFIVISLFLPLIQLIEAM